MIASAANGISISLKAPAAVYSGSKATFGVVFDSITTPVSAFDLKLYFDASVFDFVEVVPKAMDKGEFDTNVKNGSIICSYLDSDMESPISTSGTIFEVVLQVKNTAKPGTAANFSFSIGAIGNVDEGSLEFTASQLTVTVQKQENTTSKTTTKTNSITSHTSKATTTASKSASSTTLSESASTTESSTITERTTEAEPKQGNTTNSYVDVNNGKGPKDKESVFNFPDWAFVLVIVGTGLLGLLIGFVLSRKFNSKNK
jgi:hypothetical protein